MATAEPSAKSQPAGGVVEAKAVTDPTGGIAIVDVEMKLLSIVPALVETTT